MWSHEQSVADRQNRRAIDHHSIEKFSSLSDQLADERSGEDLSRIGSAPPTGEHEQLTASCSQNLASHGNVLVNELEFSRRNLACCRGYVRFTDETIGDSGGDLFLGIIFHVGRWKTEDFVHVR